MENMAVFMTLHTHTLKSAYKLSVFHSLLAHIEKAEVNNFHNFFFFYFNCVFFCLKDWVQHTYMLYTYDFPGIRCEQ